MFDKYIKKEVTEIKYEMDCEAECDQFIETGEVNSMGPNSLKCEENDINQEHVGRSECFGISNDMKPKKKRKNASEVKKCEFCSYKTKHKSHFRTHMLTHKNSSELQWFHCDSCNYKSKYKKHLRRHVLNHRTMSEVEFYRCSECQYRTKHVNCLNRHKRTHNNFDGDQLHECDHCGVKLRAKTHLTRHMKMHCNKAAEVIVFKCGLCDYQSVTKKGLKRHIVNHKKGIEVEPHKCDVCGYESMRRDCLTRHMRKHVKKCKA